MPLTLQQQQAIAIASARKRAAEEKNAASPQDFVAQNLMPNGLQSQIDDRLNLLRQQRQDPNISPVNEALKIGNTTMGVLGDTSQAVVNSGINKATTALNDYANSPPPPPQLAPLLDKYVASSPVPDLANLSARGISAAMSIPDLSRPTARGLSAMGKFVSSGLSSATEAASPITRAMAEKYYNVVDKGSNIDETLSTLGNAAKFGANVTAISPAIGIGEKAIMTAGKGAASVAGDARVGMAQALKNRAEKAYVPTADNLAKEVDKAYSYSRNAGVKLNDAGVKELMSVVDNQAVKSDLAKSVGNKDIETMLGRIKDSLQKGNGLPLKDYIEFEKEINKRLSGNDAVNSLGEYSDVGMALNSLKHDMRNAVTKMANSSLGGPQEAVDAYRQGLQLSVKKHQLDDLETVMRRARNKGAKNTIHNEMSKIDIAGAQGYTPEQQALIASMAKKSKISDYATGAYAKGAAGLAGYVVGGPLGAAAGYTAPFVAEHLLDRAAISNLNKLKQSIGKNAKFVEPKNVSPAGAKGEKLTLGGLSEGLLNAKPLKGKK